MIILQMTMDTNSKASSELKEAGNAAYKDGDFDAALAHYTEVSTFT